MLNGLEITQQLIPVCIANMIGLVIQSFDAGRGLLSNTLLQMMKYRQLNGAIGDRSKFNQFVEETLRYDPPVHNTRRILAEDIQLEGKHLKKGQTVIVVLASANRDPSQFRNPGEFDIFRPNNIDHITFGFGLHACLADHFSIKMAAEALHYLFEGTKGVQLLDPDTLFEPLVNVRLPKRILCSIDL
jgi:cytochrome P450